AGGHAGDGLFGGAERQADRLGQALDACAREPEPDLRRGGLEVCESRFRAIRHLSSGNATRGIVAEDNSFTRLVALACHDLRTPLATVFGFARTLSRGGTLDEVSARYVQMIESASEQIGELLDELSVAT